MTQLGQESKKDTMLRKTISFVLLTALAGGCDVKETAQAGETGQDADPGGEDAQSLEEIVGLQQWRTPDGIRVEGIDVDGLTRFVAEVDFLDAGGYRYTTEFVEDGTRAVLEVHEDGTVEILEGHERLALVERRTQRLEQRTRLGRLPITDLDAGQGARSWFTCGVSVLGFGTAAAACGACTAATGFCGAACLGGVVGTGAYMACECGAAANDTSCEELTD